MDDNQNDTRLNEALARIDDLEHAVDKLAEVILEAIPPSRPALRIVGRDGP